MPSDKAMKTTKEWTEEMENIVGGCSLKKLQPIVSAIRAEARADAMQLLEDADGLLKGIQYATAQAPDEYRGARVCRSITIERSQEGGINALLDKISNLKEKCNEVR